MNEPFIPLIPPPTPPAPAAAAFPPNATGPVAPASATPPRVTVKREGEQVSHITVHCACGHAIELACVY